MTMRSAALLLLLSCIACRATSSDEESPSTTDDKPPDWDIQIMVLIVVGCLCVFGMFMTVICAPFWIMGFVAGVVFIAEMYWVFSECCAEGLLAWWNDNRDRAMNQNEGEKLLSLETKL